MEKTYDIDSKVQFAIGWVFETYGCKGCKNATKHDPICLLGHDIAVSRGAHGKIVIINPHPSVLGTPRPIASESSPSEVKLFMFVMGILTGIVLCAIMIAIPYAL